jgi:hypothetical protein
MGAPFENTDLQGFWRHPAHVRKCKLARENSLEIAKSRGAAKIRRKKLMDTIRKIALYGGTGIGAIALTWEIMSMIFGRP